MTTEKSAYITSGVIVALLAAGGGYYAVQQNTQVDVEEPAPISHTVKKETITADQAANIGQKYIEDLAFMLDQPDDIPVLLSSTEEVDHDTWLAKYFLQVSSEFSYHIDVEIMSGRVIEHSMKVIAKDGMVSISDPEPSELISSKQFVVKGETKESGIVSINLLSKDLEELEAYTLDQTETGTTIFAQNIQTTNLEPGEYVLQAMLNKEHLVTLPIVISRSSL